MNAGGGKRFNTKRKTHYCTYCNNIGHTIDTCYRNHGFPPNQMYRGKSATGPSFSNANNFSSNHVPSFAANVSTVNHHDYNVHGISDTKNMNIATGLGGVTDGLSNEQYEKLIFLLNNTQLSNKCANTSCSGTGGGAEVIRPIVIQTMAYQATSNDGIDNFSQRSSSI